MTTPPNSPSPRAPIVSAEVISTLKTRRHNENEFVESQKGSLLPTKEDHPVSEENEPSSSSKTLWEAICTVYLPLFGLWLWQSIVGVIQLIRVVLFGHVLRFIVTYVIPLDYAHPHSWLHRLAGPTADSATLHKGDLAQSWSPPALISIAVLTVFVLIIHPDGTTWSILGKLSRNTMGAFLDFTSFCWDCILQESTVIPTVVAACTFLALFGFIWVLHRTLTPRTPKKKPTATPEKQKKKKRRGNHRGGRGRQSSHRQQQQRSKKTERAIPEEDVTERSLSPVPVVEDGRLCLEKQSDELQSTQPLPSTDVSKPEKTSKMHQRVESLDTVITVDDQSCGTASVRSNTSIVTSATAQTDHIRAAVDGIARGPSRSGTSTLNRRKTKQPRANSSNEALEAGGRFVGPKSPNSQQKAQLPPLTPLSASRLAHQKHSDSRRQVHHRRGPVERGQIEPALQHTPSSSFFSSTPDTRTPSGHNEERRNTHTFSDRQHDASPSLFFHEPAVPLSAPTHVQPTTPSAGGMRLPPGFECSTPNSGSVARAQNARKMELASLLSQVGLAGTARDDLLEALDGVDALAKMSDAQYELYNVPLAQKAQIELLLDLRRHSTISPMASPSSGRPVASLPPPPGLELPTNSGDTMNMPLLLSPPRVVGLASLEIPNLESNSQAHTWASAASLRTSSADSAYGSSLYTSLPDQNRHHEDNDEEASRIEAELQELGGQMVGSVLDF